VAVLRVLCGGMQSSILLIRARCLGIRRLIRGARSTSRPFWPASPYAAAKALGCYLARVYSQAYVMFSVCGMEFVTKKISNTVAQIKLGLRNRLGHLEARRD